MRSRILLAALWGAPPCFAASPLVERVDKTAFIQLEANSLQKLTPQQQALAYWLTQASIAIDPIFYAQLSRFGLLEKRMLEVVVAHKD